MSLADALKGIKETQAPLKTAELKKPKPAKPQTPVAPLAPAERTPEPAAAARQGRGKRTNPEYEKVTFYARRALRRQAERKFEDAGGRDFSDLIETLLRNYMDG